MNDKLNFIEKASDLMNERHKGTETTESVILISERENLSKEEDTYNCAREKSRNPPASLRQIPGLVKVGTVNDNLK